MKPDTGCHSHEVSTAEGGWRVTIVEFGSDDALRVWSTRSEHLKAMEKGRRLVYAECRLQVRNVVPETFFGGEDTHTSVRVLR